jgi:hypothetical protein
MTVERVPYYMVRDRSWTSATIANLFDVPVWLIDSTCLSDDEVWSDPWI